jgi:voltage-gated anion channel
MATGIVSIAAADHGYRGVSFALATVASVLLAALTIAALVWLRPDVGELDTALQLLTFVAACAVVGTRLGWWPLGVVALLGWLVLMPAVVRGMWRQRWVGLRDRARGGWELASVATSGLAIVAADAGLARVAIGLLTLALCLYCVMTGLVVWRACGEFSAIALRQPDIWIVMGGAAIATLAGDHIHRAGFDGVRPVTIVTWLVASAWLLLLAAASFRLRAGNWWAAVFPLGMYSSATYATFVETGWRPLATVSLVFFWIAFAAWLLTLAISARYRSLSAG